MMYQGDIFWVEQLIAYCIAAILWCIIDKINSSPILICNPSLKWDCRPILIISLPSFV